MILFPSWPGLPSKSFLLPPLLGVDARDKPGLDELSKNLRFYWLHFESGSQDVELIRREGSIAD
jgi:hypothetical protein